MTGKALKKLRESEGLTQGELAEALGVHFTTVSKLEHGRKITADMEFRIMRAIGQLRRAKKQAGSPSERPGLEETKEQVKARETHSENGSTIPTDVRLARSLAAMAGVMDRLTKTQVSDPVNHPAHYTFGKHEVIDVIEDWGLTEAYHLACAVKYIARSGKKDVAKEREDLEKAIWYLRRYIDSVLVNPT